MTSKAINLSLAFTLAFVVWGCKKESASAGAQVAQPPVAAAAEAAPDMAASPSAAEPIAAAPEQKKEAPAAENIVVVKLQTTKGEIIIDVHPDWAPLGAARFLELVKSGFFTDVAFYRVIKGFMAQAGLSGDPKQNIQWQSKRIEDEPVKQSNLRGTVTFAMGGPNTRTTQFFINFVDNKSLDKQGFAPFGKVRDMTAADALFSGYGDGAAFGGKGPDQNKLGSKGNKYLKKSFPDLDYITSASVAE